MNKDVVRQTIARYEAIFEEDKPVVAELLSLINTGAGVTSRKEFRGHITCGAILIGEENRLLMIHHLALNQWLFPGGHIEKSDILLYQAAARELMEETGIKSESLGKFENWLDNIPIQIDCHPIPENKSKEEPAHKHWDFRFAFPLIGIHQLVSLQREEVTNSRWVGIDKAPVKIAMRLDKYVFKGPER